MGAHTETAENLCWVVKLQYILMVPIAESCVTPQELAAAIPSVEELISYTNAGLGHSMLNAMIADGNACAFAAMALEKFGLHEQAIPYAEHVATCMDVTKGGCYLPSVHCTGYRIKGRCNGIVRKFAR